MVKAFPILTFRNLKNKETDYCFLILRNYLFWRDRYISMASYELMILIPHCTLASVLSKPNLSVFITTIRNTCRNFTDLMKNRLIYKRENNKFNLFLSLKVISSEDSCTRLVISLYVLPVTVYSFQHCSLHQYPPVLDLT